MNMNPAVEAWIVIEKLGALCATPGIEEATQKLANEQVLSIDNVWNETLVLSIAELSEAHFGTLPAIFGPTVG